MQWHCVVPVDTSTLQKLQWVHNNLPRVVCGVSKFQLRLSEDVLHELHWLPIRQRIHYKIATITYRALHLQQPSYISSLLFNYVPPRTLRSASHGLLNTPGSRTVIGKGRFSPAAPVTWNNLPHTDRSAETIENIRTRLRTYLPSLHHRHMLSCCWFTYIYRDKVKTNAIWQLASFGCLIKQPNFYPTNFNLFNPWHRITINVQYKSVPNMGYYWIKSLATVISSSLESVKLSKTTLICP